MDVRIGRCTAGEIGDVVRFIAEHWKPNHVLTTCRPLLDWQHRDADGAGYSFVLARRPSDGELLGILGYISTSRFDPALAADRVVWLTTWKVRDDAGVAGLGIRLLQHLNELEPHVAIGAVGFTPSTLPIYQAFAYDVGELHHYVFRARQRNGDSAAHARRLTTDADFASARSMAEPHSVPRKSAEYFRQRYLRHPLYQYAVYAILESDSVVGLLAVRLAEHDGLRALRIVDFAGAAPLLGRIGPHLDALLAEFRADYADVYNAGIGDAIFEQAGFAKVDPDGNEIVPDHFEPFERRNVRLWYAIKGAPAVIFKGDGDQDRPNRL